MPDAAPRRTDSFSVRSLERGLDILALLNRHNGLTVTETAEQVGLPRPTAFRLLRTLERLGYIFRDDADKKYRLTAQVRGLSHGYDQEEWLPKIARPIMVEVCKKILWPLTMVTNMGSQMLVRDSTHDISPFAMWRHRGGFKIPLLHTAAGQVYLAYCGKDVRQALSYAVDTNAIIKGVLHGFGSPMGSFISKYYPYGSDPDIKPYAYDPGKARELLKRAGFPNGIEVKLYGGNDQPKELGEAVAAFWGQVGIKTEIVRMDYPAFIRLNNTHKAGPATVTIFSNVIYDPVHPIVGTFSKEGTWSNYYNADVETLIKELDGTLGPEARGALFRKIGRILHDDAAAVYISEHLYVYGKKKDLKWQVQQGSGFLNFRNAGWK
jgi:hypothetical protein